MISRTSVSPRMGPNSRSAAAVKAAWSANWPQVWVGVVRRRCGGNTPDG